LHDYLFSDMIYCYTRSGNPDIL